MTDQNNNNPIWARPGWIAAITGLITALITIPAQVGSYYKDKLEAEKMKEEIKLAQQERVLLTALEHTGMDRVVVLRYIVKTSEDDIYRNWAKSEIGIIEDLIEGQHTLKKVKAAFESEASEEQILLNKQEYERLEADLSKQFARAGIINTDAVSRNTMLSAERKIKTAIRKTFGALSGAAVGKNTSRTMSNASQKDDKKKAVKQSQATKSLHEKPSKKLSE